MSIATPQFSTEEFVPEELAALANRRRPFRQLPRMRGLSGSSKRPSSVFRRARSLPWATRGPWSWSRSRSSLVLTSPPYWTLKEYRDTEGQLGHVDDYETFLDELDKVWNRCFHALTPGGRLICVVGDVCLRGGRTTAATRSFRSTRRSRSIAGRSVSTIWPRSSGTRSPMRCMRSRTGRRFSAKPYEPNAVIKNDIEFILMERKPGGYRQPSVATRVSKRHIGQNHKAWFQQIWTGPDRGIDEEPSGPVSAGTGRAADSHVQLCGRYGARSVPGHGNDNPCCHAEWAKLNRLRDRQELSFLCSQTDP